MTQKFYNDLTHEIIGASIDVHKAMGPGLLESVYEHCLILALREKGLHLLNQQRVPVRYMGQIVQCDLRYDILVENSMIIEVKSCDKILPIHEAQIMTYLKLMKKPKGIIINFNCCNIFHEGQKTFVTEEFMKLPKGY